MMQLANGLYFDYLCIYDIYNDNLHCFSGVDDSIADLSCSGSCTGKEG